MSTRPLVGRAAEPEGELVPVNWPAGIVQVRVVFAVARIASLRSHTFGRCGRSMGGVER
jgi:hypothetical protein